MHKLLPLILIILGSCLAVELDAQSRRGNVLDAFGNKNGDRFGATVSLSNDGNRLAVMAPDNGRFGTGNPEAEVYELQGANWVRVGNRFEDYFTSPTDEEATIAISGNGNTVATGEAAFNTTQNLSAGRVLTYRLSGSNWSTIGTELNGSYADARYGEKIVLINNGSQMMTGNFGGEANDPRGAFNLVYSVAQGWQPVGTQPILQSNNEIAVSGLALSLQGLSVGIGLDKGAGAPGEVQRFRFAGDWVSLGSVNGSSNGDGFGESIAMGINGATIAIGAPYDENGKVRVYNESNTQIGGTIIGGANDEAFGYSVDISEDGTRVAIGAPANAPSSTGTGNVYVYDLIGNSWTLQYSFSGTVVGEQTGQSVALSNDGMYLAIGRPGFEAAGESDAGQVDVFNLDGSSSTKEANNLSLTAYPNPTQDLLNVMGTTLTTENVQVRDALGRLVAVSVIDSDRIDVQHLGKGYYFLEVTTTEGIGRISFVKE